MCPDLLLMPCYSKSLNMCGNVALAPTNPCDGTQASQPYSTEPAADGSWSSSNAEYNLTPSENRVSSKCSTQLSINPCPRRHIVCYQAVWFGTEHQERDSQSAFRVQFHTPTDGYYECEDVLNYKRIVVGWLPHAMVKDRRKG